MSAMTWYGLRSGPDGIRDHRVRVDDEHRYVGEGTMSPEGTSEVEYLWRAPRDVPHPKPKTACVGEIGWGIPHMMDWSTPMSGLQIALGEFRQAVEDRHTHLYQNPWYPPSEYRSYNESRPSLPALQTGYTPRPRTTPDFRRRKLDVESSSSSSSHSYSRYRPATASSSHRYRSSYQHY